MQDNAWFVSEWFNTPEALSLPALRGQVVLLHTFQMLCPGCVAHGLPLAQRAAEVFAQAPLQIIGLHTVFEHHEAMPAVALKAFLHEYRVHHPVGVDAPDPEGGPIPRTMRAYGLQGTPSVLLFDAQGQLRQHVFGHYEEMRLGADIARLLSEHGASGVAPARGIERPR